ncbi:hypothetical protein GCM10011491_42340 [Brucella endophytica]|uniref:Uncharacterized protein n=1 Tax=Brucella endophytica TaxID=1963359 RepID=A0A916SNR4_9HYPH|nr:hypothetical protein GCM10011491_42340 [Brucella endophytica]
MLESFRREVTEEFHAVAPLDKRLPFCRTAFEFDRLHLAAVLFPLKAALRLLIVVEFALHPVGSAVKEIDGAADALAATDIDFVAATHIAPAIQNLHIHGTSLHDGHRKPLFQAHPVTEPRSALSL